MAKKQEIITRKAVGQVLKDYGNQYKANWKVALVGFLFPAIGTIFVFFVPPLIVERLINLLVAQGQISLSLAKNYIILFAALWLLGEVLWRVGIHFLIKLEAKALNDLGDLAFRRLSSRDYKFYTENFVGSLTKKALAFSRGFEIFTDTMGFNILTNTLPALFAVVVLWRYSPWIPIILVVSLTVVILVALPIIRRRSRLVALRHDASSKVAGRLSDSMTNIMAIKSFAEEKEELSTFKDYVADLSAKFKKAADYQNLRFDTIVSPLYVTTNVFGLVAAIFFTNKLNLQPGAIVVVFTYYTLVTRIFWEINRVYRNIESSVSEAAEFVQLFIDEPMVKDTPAAKNLKITKADIAFKNVNFKYSDQNVETKMFLQNFDLEIPGQQKVGLIGPSGGGKTTITKLLLRFIDTQSGSIEIDGQDIKKITQESLRKNIAYVPQEPLLFHRPLLENIAYGNKKATKEEIIKAAKLAHADEFISKLPQGYQTLVGERGVKLSGGQKQRVAIARAILKNAPILVLDEATSSLDSESEKYIQEGLWELMKNKTALVIAHRLSTIKHLDRIIVLDEGQIVQDGTHEELLQQKGIYATLWKHQSGGFL